MIEITDEVKQQLMADGFTEQEINEFKEEYKPAPDKTLFHKFDKNGNPTGIFDKAIINYLMENEDMFILGGNLYIYQKGVYKRDFTDSILKSKIQQLFYDQFVTARNVNRVHSLIMMQNTLHKETWELNRFPDSCINFQNGMLDLKTGEIFPHSPKYMSVNQIPHRYKRLTAEDMLKYPNLNYFLKSSLDAPDVRTILEFMGLCMTHNVDHQFFLLLLGEGGNGKSLVIALLEYLLGVENISNVSLDELTRQFYPSHLFGKLANTCADLSKVSISDDAMIKKITGGDRIPCEFKGKDAFFFTPYAKLFFSANRFPHVDDKSDGFKRRTRVVSMNKKPEKVDIKLKQKLLHEIECLVYLVVQAAREVFKSGQVFESESSKEMKKEIAKKSDSVYAFISDCLLPMEGHNIKRSETFVEYKQYCDYFDRTALGRNTFFKEMEAKGFTAISGDDGIFTYRGYVFSIWREEDHSNFQK